MRRQVLAGLLLSGLLVGPFGAVYDAQGQQITTEETRFLVSDDRRSVVVLGTWRRVSQRSSVEVPHVNSARIECDRAGRVCSEYIAKLIQEIDDPAGAVKQPYLFLMKQQFRVIEWTATTITARAEPRAADIDLRISLVDQVAERTSRETGARGAQGANPANITQWVLR